MSVKTKEFAIAICVLAAIIAICVLIYYFITVQHPRRFWLNSSKNLDNMMKNVYEDLNTYYFKINNVYDKLPVKIPKTLAFIDAMINVYDPTTSRTPLTTKGAPLRQCGDKSGQPNSNLESYPQDAPKPPRQAQQYNTTLALYLYYDNVLKSNIDNYIFKTVFKRFKPLSECSTDNERGYETVEDAIMAVEEVQDELRAAVIQMTAFEKEGQVLSPELVDACVSVHMLHYTLVTCADQLKEMHDIRRFSLINYLLILVRPLVHNILIKEVYALWTDLFDRETIDNSHKSFESFWYWIGNGEWKVENKDGTTTTTKSNWVGINNIPRAILNFIKSLGGGFSC